MISRLHLVRGMAAVAALVLLLLPSAPIVAAHGHTSTAGFDLVVGWAGEPALVGEPNAVELFVYDVAEQPITDIPPGAIDVVVSTAGQDSASLGVSPAFDVAEGSGTLGKYSAEIIPTAPGDYTFHFTGTIHGKHLDVSMSSGDQTFDGVVAPDDLEFPVKQPTLTEVGTRLDRIDGRIDVLQSAGPAPRALAELQDAAAGASASAERALLVGALMGGAGLVVAVVALVLVLRARRPDAEAR